MNAQAYRRARELGRALRGEADPETVAAESELAETLIGLNLLDEAEVLVAGIREHTRGPSGEETLAGMQPAILAGRILGLRRRYDEAQVLLERGLALGRARLGEDDDETIDSILALAMLRGWQGRHREAIALYEEGLAAQERAGSSQRMRGLHLRHNLAGQHYYLGEIEIAREHLERVLESEMTVLGEDDYRTLATRAMLAEIQRAQGRFEEAVETLRDVALRMRRAVGDGDLMTQLAIENLAGTLQSSGRFDEAIAYVEGLVAILRRVESGDGPKTLKARAGIAMLLANQGWVTRAGALFLDLVAQCSAFTEDDADCARVEGLYGWFLLNSGARYEEAERLLLRSEKVLQTALGPRMHERLDTVVTLVDLYRKWGRNDEAECWRRELENR